jgi:SNF2 family DNA or RNA helicase
MLSSSLIKKINTRVIDLFENAYKDNELDSIDIKQEILNKLLPYQTLHTINMISAVKKNISSIDASSTGTGKTYVISAVCKQLQIKPLVICPKSIIGTWKNILKSFDVKYIDVINYEAILSKTKDKNSYVELIDNNYVWKFEDNNVLIIFDEAHKCKNPKTNNGKLLLSTKDKIKTILLSATICDKDEDFYIFGYILGLYKRQSEGVKWLGTMRREMKNQYKNKSTNILENFIFPQKGSKMSMTDLGDSYPKNQISIECYSVDDKDKETINKYYEEVKMNKFKIVANIKMRQVIENIKVKIMCDLCETYYLQNNSIVFFVNFRSSFALIEKYLTNKNILFAKIDGSQTDVERQDNIDLFQTNKVRAIICMIQTGGISISLHDINGTNPRISLISPSYSHIELIQTLGRIYRSGCLTPCVQKIIFCEDTFEENIVSVLKNKKNMLDTLSDKDFEF